MENTTKDTYYITELEDINIACRRLHKLFSNYDLSKNIRIYYYSIDFYQKFTADHGHWFKQNNNRLTHEEVMKYLNNMIRRIEK